jgi:hypothetical protein
MNVLYLLSLKTWPFNPGLGPMGKGWERIFIFSLPKPDILSMPKTFFSQPAVYVHIYLYNQRVSAQYLGAFELIWTSLE